VITSLLAATLFAATPELKNPEEKIRLAVMSISAAGVPDEYAVGLTETIATTIADTGVFETISPRQISSLLAYEKRRDALGGCVEEACYRQIAKLVKAGHLVSGSIAKVGDELTLNLVLIDAKEGSAAKRENRKSKHAADLMTAADEAAIALLQPLLGARQGFLRVAANVPDAELVVDGELRSEGLTQVVALPAGPHIVKLKRAGFYTATAEVKIRPGLVHTEKLALIPAKDTIESYETTANAMRIGAYTTGALAVVGAVAGVLFYTQATDDKLEVDRFASGLSVERAAPGARDAAVQAQDSFNTNQSLYFVGLGTAVVAGATSLILFLTGDDPDRYDEFEGLEGQP